MVELLHKTIAQERIKRYLDSWSKSRSCNLGFLVYFDKTLVDSIKMKERALLEGSLGWVNYKYAHVDTMLLPEKWNQREKDCICSHFSASNITWGLQEWIIQRRIRLVVIFIAIN